MKFQNVSLYNKRRRNKEPKMHWIFIIQKKITPLLITKTDTFKPRRLDNTLNVRKCNQQQENEMYKKPLFNIVKNTK